MTTSRKKKPATRICPGCEVELAADRDPRAKFCTPKCKHNWHCRQTKRRRREEAKAAKLADDAKRKARNKRRREQRAAKKR